MTTAEADQLPASRTGSSTTTIQPTPADAVGVLVQLAVAGAMWRQ